MKTYVLFLPFIISLSACNRDVDDVQIEGVIIDATTSLPVSKAYLRIENAYYQGGDYDSYGGYDSLKMMSDSVGAFRLKFHKSAFLQVKAHKSGYQEGFLEKDIVSNQSKIILSLKKQ